jgi:hypothetical protein
MNNKKISFKNITKILKLITILKNILRNNYLKFLKLI